LIFFSLLFFAGKWHDIHELTSILLHATHWYTVLTYKKVQSDHDQLLPDINTNNVKPQLHIKENGLGWQKKKKKKLGAMFYLTTNTQNRYFQYLITNLIVLSGKLAAQCWLFFVTHNYWKSIIIFFFFFSWINRT
jgi:hypothetical protein